MRKRELFDGLPAGTPKVVDAGGARFQEADRKQMRLESVDLDALVPADHLARAIWALIGKLDLSKFYDAIASREHTPGRPPPDPRIMVALWLYAYSDGVGTARQLDALCQKHDVYRWICGGVAMNYHSLADFRTSHAEALEDLMAQVLAALASQGLVKFKRVSQDGLRVRASAGAASFRRKGTLDRLLAEAREHVANVKKAAEKPDGQRNAREQAAQERAAREREERVRRAAEAVEKLKAKREQRNERVGPKAAQDPEKVRASTTDSEARVMKMPDGGYRPGYNIQLATDVGSGFVVGVQVSNSGSDAGLMRPMLDHLEEKLGTLPAEYLMDGGYVNGAAITHATNRGVVVYAPPKISKSHPDPYAPSRHDNAALRQWRARMTTAKAKEIYKERASTAELTNARLRLRAALRCVLVRGVEKVKTIAHWAALALNLRQWLALERSQAGT